jgi:hypothetical protein
MRIRVVSLAACLMFALPAPPPLSANIQPQQLEAPAPANSFAPQLARTSHGSILMSWLESTDGKSHRFRVSRYRAGTWEAPVTITEGAQFFANWADVPSVSEQAGIVFAHWLEKNGPGTYAYEVTARSPNMGSRPSSCVRTRSPVSSGSTAARPAATKDTAR